MASDDLHAIVSIAQLWYLGGKWYHDGGGLVPNCDKLKAPDNKRGNRTACSEHESLARAKLELAGIAKSDGGMLRGIRFVDSRSSSGA